MDEIKKILDCEVSHDVDGSFKISLKSFVDWSFLASTVDKKTMKIGGILCSKPKRDNLKGLNSRFILSDEFEYDEYPNLILLLAPDIGNGVTFDFGKIPISEESIYDWVNRFKEQIKILYLLYVKPVNIKVSFSTQTVENEIHD